MVSMADLVHAPQPSRQIWAYRKGYLAIEGPLAVTNQNLPVWRAIVVSMMNGGKPGQGAYDKH